MGIEFRNVSKRYPGSELAVTDFSLTIPSHQFTVFLGSSGSGKTTLLRMINRMVVPTSGSVLIDDVDVATVNPVTLRRGIGYVLQAAGLMPHRTVIDNVATVPMLLGTPRRRAREDAMAVLERVGLDSSLAQRYPAQLSGGQQQRVGVARALAADPNILLMDEPFGAVDPLVRRDLQQELLHLQNELDKTIVFVTHDIDEAMLLGEQVVLFRDKGVVAQIGTPAELVNHPASDFVADFVGSNRGERELRGGDGSAGGTVGGPTAEAGADSAQAGAAGSGTGD